MSALTHANLVAITAHRLARSRAALVVSEQLTLGTMLAHDKWAEFRMHVRAVLVEGGFTPDDIKEIIIQQAIYCGVPAANHAFKEAGHIIAELGKA